MRKLLVLALLMFGAFAVAEAAIRPSFRVDHSSWHATDIVVVTATAIDGRFTVIETLKGNLTPNQLVTIPELTPKPDSLSISEYPSDYFPRDEKAMEVPRQLSGLRLVLFLQKSSVTGSSGQIKGKQWIASDIMGEMKASVVWFEGSQPYCFIQTINPGASTFQRCFMFTEQKLRDRIREVLRTQRELDDIAGIEDGAARANALKPYSVSDIIPARLFALEQLAKCGPTAEPVLMEMLEDSKFDKQSAELVRALVASGGESTSQDLSNLLQSDLVYWKSVGPALPTGWWNRDPGSRETEQLISRYSRVLEIVRGLRQIHHVASIGAITEMRDLWQSQPQLNDPSGTNQITTECEDAIHQLRPE